MQVPLFRRLEDDLEHAVLISLEVSPGRRQARLRMAVLPGGRPGTPRRELTVVLHGVSRVAASPWQAEPGSASAWAEPDGYHDEPVHNLQELNDRLRLWSGCRLADQPGDVFDAPDIPPWLDWASLDVVSPEPPGDVHSLDLQLGDGVRADGRMLDLRIEFDDLEVIPGPRLPDANQGGRPAAMASPSPQQRPQQRKHGRRGVSARIRRRRAVAAVAAVSAIAVVGLLAAWLTSGPGKHAAAAAAAAAAARHGAAAHPLPAAEAGLMPWHLAAPISRETLVADPAGQLIVLGGLTAGGGSANGVYAVRPVSGITRLIGVLKAPVHDAAAAMLGDSALVFGGGSPATVATVQAVGLHGQASGAPTAVATVAGSLPVPRSDAAAVTIGGTAYVVGGYDGHGPDAPVLATNNGRSFATIARLPVPVRYPAVAVLGGQIYVFGGQAISGPHAGAPVDVIQAVDPAQHTAAVIGTLPEPLAGAVAVTLGGEVFVAGGESSVAQQTTPGLGATQLASVSGSSATASPPATSTVSTIWAFDPATRRLLPAGRLQVPVSHAAVAVTGNVAWIVGGESGGTLVSAVQMLRPNPAFGTAGAPGAGSPYFGYRLLIADRGNNRLLLLDAGMHVVWRYPSASSPKDRYGFYFPDDAFFIDHGTAIISNQEQNETIVKIAYPSGKIIWFYGHPGKPGSALGYLHEPDDAYLLSNGQISVADADNCRVLVINPNKTVAHQIGTNGVCAHNPPTSMGSPNGDTPLRDGNLLISEINGSWVSEYTMTGKLVWTVQLPISYPSDPQQLGPDRYLIADYAAPGSVLEFNRQGSILYRYRPTSGPGMLNHPSLSEMLPSGVIMANDDYNDRVVAIDPQTGALVWQYGVTGRPGTALGRLNTPDGFDLLGPNGQTPTHPITG